MLSIQETVDKASQQLQSIEHYMDSNGCYDPYICGRLLYQGLKRSVQREVSETIRRLSIREFLVKGDATGYGGTAGSNYLTAAVLSSKIFVGMSARDRAPAVAASIIEEPQGETINVATAWAKAYSAGEAGESPQSPIFDQSAITYEKWKCPLVASSDMMEDSGYALIDLAAQNAGIAIASKTNDQLLSVLKRSSGTTGFGSKVATASGNSTTTPTHIATCVGEVAGGTGVTPTLYHPNVLVISPEAWNDAVTITAGHPDVYPPRTPLYDAWYSGLDTVIVNSYQLGTVTSERLDLAVSLILEKECALAVARKHWLRIENYADPQRDLSGAVITARQACGEIVNGAIGVLTET